MSPFPVDYPADFFRITQADMDRIARRMEQTGLTRNLTDLGRHFVRGRLRYGAEKGDPLRLHVRRRDQVRVWDPGRAWHVGDYAVMAIPALRDRLQIFVPAIGEILRIQGNSATIRVDGLSTPSVYGLTGREHRDAFLDHWRDSIEATVAALRHRSDEASRIDYLMWTGASEVWGRLLSALRHDTRFVMLQGEWFLGSLVVRPSKAALEELARVMLRSAQGPSSVADLMPLCPAGGPSGAAGLIGLNLAMQERPDLFTNVDPGSAPRWVRAVPPPGTYTARQAAYDPDNNYTLLCEPGDLLGEDVLHRLWELGLLDVVL